MTQTEVEILLVEDSAADVELTMHVMRRHKLANRIQVVRDGEEALDFIFCRGEFSDRSFMNHPKLILLDIKLPKVDGLEVLRILSMDIRTKGIPVVILTSSEEDSDLIEAYQLGVSGYIQKPVNFDRFQETVQQLGLYWLLVDNLRPLHAVSTETSK